MPTLLFTVEDTFAIKNLGLIIAGFAPDEARRLPNIGQAVELYRPDGSLIQSKVTGIEIRFNMGVTGPFWLPKLQKRMCDLGPRFGH